MTERRGDQGFAVVARSISGGSGRGPRRPRQLGVGIVLLASLALIVVGFLGPRMSGPPSFDIGYFATPTPRDTPTPTPEPTFPNQTPLVTPLPTLTRPEGAPVLTGGLLLTGSAIQRLDLATGDFTTVQPMMSWQDGVFRIDDDRIACVCIEDGFGDRGATRTVHLVQIGDALIRSDLASYLTSPEASQDQTDPLFDAAVGRGADFGLLAVSTRTTTDWRISVRPFDPRAGTSGAEVPIGAVALPPPPGPTPTPTPSDAQSGTQVYLDGPHLRLAPDGRTAFVWAIGQRYSDYQDPVTTRSAWWIRLGPDGTVADVSQPHDLGALPTYCLGTTFAGDERLASVCGDPDPGSSDNGIRWFLHLFDLEGREIRKVALPESGPYGYGEPIVDDANARLVLWDAVKLAVVRVDLRDGSVASATYDPAASESSGVTNGDPPRPAAWHDMDSTVQQSPYEQIGGSADGSRLFATGFQVREGADVYGQRSLGVFVIDTTTLALVGHWAPVANDTSVAVLADGRVLIGAQPGMNAAGDQVPWAGSLTIHDAADGAIVARYGRVGTDMIPRPVGP
jgi:hypothetical protein